jgi:collagenase-like PrtC family protease
MRALQREGFEGRIIVSTIGGVLNRHAVKFYLSLGARRIILPRDLALGEVMRIVESFPGTEFETFIYNDRCPFMESHCHTLHGLPGKTSFCFTNWLYEICSREPRNGNDSGNWSAHLEHHREWLRASSNCGDTYTPTRVPNGTCGLCAIPSFLACGVVALKVVGREAPDYRKMLSVGTVQRVLARALGGMEEAQVKREALAVRGDDRLCRLGYLCYYRDANPFIAKRAAFRAKAGKRL